jgi:hypothetical protein
MAASTSHGMTLEGISRDRGEMQILYALNLIRNALIGAIWQNWQNTRGLQLAAYAPTCFSIMKIHKRYMQRL